MNEAFISLIITATLLLASPGPVPIALAAAGAAVGFRKGLPFMCGMLTGLSLVILTTFLGLAAIFIRYPLVSQIFMVISSLFLFYIAYKLATTEALISSKNRNILNYKNGFIINILNPKAYAAMVALLTQFSQSSDNTAQQVFLAAVIVFVIAVVADALWLAIGHAIKPLFNHPTYQHWVRYFFASALATVVLINLIKTFIP